MTNRYPYQIKFEDGEIVDLVKTSEVTMPFVMYIHKPDPYTAQSVYYFEKDKCYLMEHEGKNKHGVHSIEIADFNYGAIDPMVVISESYNTKLDLNQYFTVYKDQKHSLTDPTNVNDWWINKVEKGTILKCTKDLCFCYNSTWEAKDDSEIQILNKENIVKYVETIKKMLDRLTEIASKL